VNGLLSKPIERLLAVALALTAALLSLTLLIQPLWQATGDSLARLQESRFALARMNSYAAEVAQLKPVQVQADKLILDQMLLRAATAEAAAGILRNLITSTLGGQTIETLTVTGDTLLQADLKVSGAEATLLPALARLEAGTPLIRIQQLDIRSKDTKARTIEVQLRLTAQWQSDELSGRRP
jgi:type II secretory pathway component PulM